MAIGNHDTGTTSPAALPAVEDSAGTASAGEGLLQLRDVLWADFQQARRELAEVMLDEELAELGFDLAVLDEAP